ncbi:SO_0444 family Cu/Zn efflux transporter [Mucisphaera sp.]|uniref:SO_0444 family Cu/Zn efflux transporter n=1 Tax=Mucisphaera sp. TaxID=2913024 RepID=UPI003D0A7C97
MDLLTTFLQNLLDLSLEAAPWLAVGLIAAGLLKGLLPAGALARFVGKPGIGSIVRGSLIGVPLPLCSCGVIPAALGLRREGASKGATVSFLVATPQTGVDSLAVSYAMLGPLLTIARPIASVITAIAGGVAAELIDPDQPRNNPTTSKPNPPTTSSCCSTNQPEPGSCCSTEPKSLSLNVVNTPPPNLQPAPTETASDCCSTESPTPNASRLRRAWDGQVYAWTRLLDDMAIWLAIGLLAAAAVVTFVPPSTLASFGSGVPAMLAMVALGIPMYICATASTPVAASLLVAGISPGTVLVFLLAGPATNAGTVALIRKELGTASTAAYLGAIIIVAIAAGLITDLALNAAGWTGPQTHHHHEPGLWLIISWISLITLTLLTFRKAVPNRASQTTQAQSA